MEFAKQSNFRQPFSQIYFAECRSIRRFPDFESADEILRQDIFTFEDYENRFNEILYQGYSWVNLNFAGILDDALLIVIELPNRETNIEVTAVNLSLPEKRVVKNDWNISAFIKII